MLKTLLWRKRKRQRERWTKRTNLSILLLITKKDGSSNPKSSKTQRTVLLVMLLKPLLSSRIVDLSTLSSEIYSMISTSPMILRKETFLSLNNSPFQSSWLTPLLLVNGLLKNSQLMIFLSKMVSWSPDPLVIPS